MNFVTVLNVHNNPDGVVESLESIEAFLTDKIVVVVDGLGWEAFKDFSYKNAIIVEGFEHGVNRSQYKNCALGLIKAYNKWPDAEWYCYIEFDVAFLNDGFKQDLKTMYHIKDLSLVATDVMNHDQDNDHWMVSDILQRPTKGFKTLGAVMCFTQMCLNKWNESNFLYLLLEKTKLYKGDFFPNFHAYAVEEVIFPTAAAAFGKILDISRFNPAGYTVRFQPEVEFHELNRFTSLAHPSKDFDGKVRKYSKSIRNLSHDRLPEDYFNIISRIYL